ncbi:MAG: hypothetical protein JJU29_02325 [Verrucomicrobia bacterium]|nr:hypothetical protein [Verrucomicrobiota bacterium]MCH8511173.1 hypothetical protein [Kiritimatiellia bacterium]
MKLKRNIFDAFNFKQLLPMAAMTAMMIGPFLLAMEPKVAPVDPASIPEERYVTVRDGQLWSEGERQRYWAVIGRLYPNAGALPEDNPEEVARKVETARKGTEILLDRFDDLGFNAMRLWAGFSGEDVDFVPGDGSAMDDANYFLARAGDRGFKVWMAGMNQVGDARPGDVDVIEDPETAGDWIAALEEAGGRMRIRNHPARVWDPRIQALGIQRMQRVANHYNPYTGLRWADDPVFAVWELSNEEWWIRRMLGGSWQKLPAFFRNQLIDHWHDFLRETYGDEAALAAAWQGLLPGESLDQGTVLFAPMDKPSPAQISINDAGAHALAALEALEQEYSREDFSDQRGRDVLRFLTEMLIQHKQKEMAAIKPLGRSTRRAPVILDTGIGYRIQVQYMLQHGEAIAHDAYVNGVGRDRWANVDLATDELGRRLAELEARAVEPNEGRWNNWLLKPPGIAQGVPWLEHNRAPGMPYLVYETQIQQPAKYRADYPLRLAALAMIQDWDFVCWHYFGDNSLHQVALEDRPFDKPMDISTGGHPQGYHYTYDEVQSSMMRAAGHMFRSGLLQPAPRPTIFLYGAQSLYDPDTMPYGRSYGKKGMAMLPTTYEHGVRLWIDPNLREDAILGPHISNADRISHNPYRPTDEMIFDWENGFLRFDAPAAVAFTGLLNRVGHRLEFENGVSLTDVEIRNDEGIFEPITEESKYISFAMHSLDGKPFAEASHISLSLVSTSFNTGFSLGDSENPTVRGELPVLHARVGGLIRSPALKGMRYTFYDWHMQPIASGRLEEGGLQIPNTQPVFVIELKRNSIESD